MDKKESRKIEIVQMMFLRTVAWMYIKDKKKGQSENEIGS